jgi:hypothetical protein
MKVLCSARRYNKKKLCSYRINCYSLSAANRHSTNKTKLQSAVGRSTQFAPSINNAAPHRSSPASCIVDVDWLKVWVQLIVWGRDGD